MDFLLNAASAICLLIGSFLCISGGLGILRLPDFYTRVHAVGVTDSLAAGMILVGLMLLSPDAFVVFKLLMVLLMTLFISPTASHALTKTAINHGLMPVLDEEDKLHKKVPGGQSSKSS